MFEELELTPSARRALELAVAEGKLIGHVGTEHVLVGLAVSRDQSVAATALRKFVMPDAIFCEVRKLMKAAGYGGSDKLVLSPRVEKALELAKREAESLKHHPVGTEHILLGLLQVEDGVALKVLRKLKVGDFEIRQEILRLLTSERPLPESVARALEKAYDSTGRFVPQLFLMELGVQEEFRGLL